MSSSSHGDEARRALARDGDVDLNTLIARLRSISAAWAIYSDEKGWAAGAMDQAARILAALRADPVRAAEEMRTSIEALNDGEHTLRYILEAWCEPDYPTSDDRAVASSYADAWLNRIAAIRSLPTQPTAEGGAE